MFVCPSGWSVFSDLPVKACQVNLAVNWLHQHTNPLYVIAIQKSNLSLILQWLANRYTVEPLLSGPHWLETKVAA